MSSSVEIPIIEMDEHSINNESLEKLKRACLEHGFFYLKNEKPSGGFHIPKQKVDRIWEISRDIFDVSIDKKMDSHVKKSKNHRGYFSSLDYKEFNKDPDGIHIKDNKEGFFFGSENLIGPGNIVPEGKEHLLPEIEEYMDYCKNTCFSLMHAVAQTKLISDVDPDSFTKDYLAKNPIYMMKLLKYPPTNGNTDAHTDYGLVTLLLPGDSGLEINSNGQWHSVPVVPDAFVINLGDLLAMWVNNSIKSTIHRVQYNSSEGKYRFSVPFFMHPSQGTVITCQGENGDKIDSYEYCLKKFDQTYSHRQKSS